MLEVIVRGHDGEAKPLRFDTVVVQVIDGALVVLRNDHSSFIAGFAPGQWLHFQVVEG